jgi:hypothetical protein
MVAILPCIPATSCSAERSFSASQRIKSYFPSKNGIKKIEFCCTN